MDTLRQSRALPLMPWSPGGPVNPCSPGMPGPPMLPFSPGVPGIPGRPGCPLSPGSPMPGSPWKSPRHQERINHQCWLRMTEACHLSPLLSPKRVRTGPTRLVPSWAMVNESPEPFLPLHGHAASNFSLSPLPRTGEV